MQIARRLDSIHRCSDVTNHCHTRLAAPGLSVELSIVMPCLNEAETLRFCIDQAFSFLREHQVDGEVLIADNGSSDGSQQIARDAGARWLILPNEDMAPPSWEALRRRGEHSWRWPTPDASYDFSSLGPFIDQLRAGREWSSATDLVAVSKKVRCLRCIATSATRCSPSLVGCFSMPRLATSTAVYERFVVRGINGLGLRTTGMEFASEMVVKACLNQALMWQRYRPHCGLTDDHTPRTCAASATAGGISASCCCIARGGSFSIRVWRGNNDRLVPVSGTDQRPGPSGQHVIRCRQPIVHAGYDGCIELQAVDIRRVE